MTIKDLHTITKSVQAPTNLSELSGHTVVVDCSPWAIKSWYNDVPSFFRSEIDDTCEKTHTYRTYFARLINGIVRAGIKVIMVLDGAPLPLKAAEHVRRGKADTRGAVMERAQAAHEKGEFAVANDEWRKLVYPAPDMVYDFVIAFCHAQPGDAVRVVVAPFEADSQCADLVEQDFADYALTIDGDFVAYGIPRVVFAAAKKKDTYHTVALADILGHSVGGYDFSGYSLADFQTVAVAVGCDYVERVYGQGWPALTLLLSQCRDAPLLGRRVSMDWGAPYGICEGLVYEVDAQTGARVWWDDGSVQDHPADELTLVLWAAALTPPLELRARFTAVLSHRNARKPTEHVRADHDFSLAAAYDAFAAPLAWRPVGDVATRTIPGGGTGKQWPSRSELSGVELVGATALLDPDAAPADPLPDAAALRTAAAAAAAAEATAVAAAAVQAADASLSAAAKAAAKTLWPSLTPKFTKFVFSESPISIFPHRSFRVLSICNCRPQTTRPLIHAYREGTISLVPSLHA